jgi:hypothetical protein
LPNLVFSASNCAVKVVSKVFIPLQILSVRPRMI